ncbi:MULTISPECIES: hypothetical protein [unclassified Bradyrhizobium]|uniref:hypothetical protein n=1 Tax=unclassified Bradyrhizobium TaxID=2631580 RepID=UPI001CD321CA|nr:MULTISPECIES: hypothetical protein [unclassified Bradyrhizobium]MCA1378768.1 hypothetical protein [Bradyrhizobium sp. IC4060]MCA1487782.1 hypothetical protein [Bradyrhizobium sp. IC4061]
MNWFLKHWRLTARGEAFRADVVAYADDFVILSCGYATEALAWTNAVITKRPHITSLAWAIFDLALRSHRAFLKVNAQHCFVLSDMSQESGEMSGVTIGTDLEKVVGASGRSFRRVRISSSVDLVPTHRLIQVSAQAAVMVG